MEIKDLYYKSCWVSKIDNRISLELPVLELVNDEPKCIQILVRIPSLVNKGVWRPYTPFGTIYDSDTSYTPNVYIYIKNIGMINITLYN